MLSRWLSRRKRLFRSRFAILPTFAHGSMLLDYHAALCTMDRSGSFHYSSVGPPGHYIPSLENGFEFPFPSRPHRPRLATSTRATLSYTKSWRVSTFLCFSSRFPPYRSARHENKTASPA
ncbi:hypothetical protein BHE74_00012734 [Ensete ventricosum]|nr:hypothetical protein GW17_00026011 [Ensete ventricosum]RWW79006.1 hypothetical protein BHE74_00012734 [Ensete ventricosum]RZS04215.1 hypothetical protein BHM03_00034506 [Ensete ventricosum]